MRNSKQWLKALRTSDSQATTPYEVISSAAPLGRGLAGILFLLLSTSASTVLAQSERVQKGPAYESAFGLYEVRMVDPPVIGYEGPSGSSARYAATKPERGSKINQFDPKVQNYRAHLRDQHDQVLKAANVPSANKIYDHGYAVNGFTVKMSFKQAQKLAKQAGVASVTPEQMSFRMSDDRHDGHDNHDGGNGCSTHQSGYDVSGFLGISGKNSLRAAGYTGKDVVIGIIDTGIWPEHPSFVDDGSYGPLPAGSFTGTACEFATSDPFDQEFTCNNKIIAASTYTDVAHEMLGEDLGGIYDDSARDEVGHGTAMASIAAGGDPVEAILSGGVDLGNMAGMAPRARLAIYKVNSVGYFFQGDFAAGVDQAVADGVDVISMSIGLPAVNFLSPDEISLLYANDAGIVTSAIVHNYGPDPGTVLAPGRIPWVLSLGAGTIDRIFTGELILKDGPRLPGVSVSSGTPSLALVNGGDCTIDEINALQLNNKIVLCENADVNSYLTVFALSPAGAKGVVFRSGLYIPGLTDRTLIAQDIGAVQGPIPSIVLESKEFDKLLMYVARTTTPKASIGKGGNIGESQGSIVTYFSSRGPAPFMEDIIKPDLVAPGSAQTVMAAAPGSFFDSLDGSAFVTGVPGTSIAAPHAAGVMAMVKQAHPDWSAAMIKSSLMTTARQDVTKENGDTPATPFDMGSGYLQADGNSHNFRGSVIDPGLVYDAGILDYYAYLCGAGFGEVSSNPDDNCTNLANSGHSLDPSNLNLPSIGIAKLIGTKTITRTVTNVARGNGVSRFDIKVKAPKGYKVVVSPSVLNVSPGQTASYKVTITNVNAPIGEWRFGSLILQGKGNAKDYQVYSPIAVRAALP